MSRPLLALLVFLSGCGFGLVKNSTHCGHHSTGADIWIDDTDDWEGPSYASDGGDIQVPIPLSTDGGTMPLPPGAMHAGITCEQAMVELDQAIDFGVRHRFWRASEVNGFVGNLRIEFIDHSRLTGEGFSNSSGVTEDYLLVHDMAVSTWGDDYSRFDPEIAPAFPWPNYQPSTVILTHELTHAYQCGGVLGIDGLADGTGKHCNWSKYYAPSYVDFGIGQAAQWDPQTASNFLDDCTNMKCAGSYCGCQPNFSTTSNDATVCVPDN